MHKSEITADIGILKADYADQQYFEAGEEVATIAIALLGPISP